MNGNTKLVARPELTTYVRKQGRLQTWLAGLIGRDKAYITHMMKARRTISRADAERISLALGETDVFVLFDVADATGNVAIRQVA